MSYHVNKELGRRLTPGDFTIVRNTRSRWTQVTMASWRLEDRDDEVVSVFEPAAFVTMASWRLGDHDPVVCSSSNGHLIA